MIEGKSRILVLFLIPIALFFFLSAPELVQKSMYNDGVWYAILSRNLAYGEGSFWYPKLTETIFPVFHEHPPLVFGIQSVLFSFLGEHVFIERLYAFIVFFLSASLIILLWREIFKEDSLIRKLAFIPLTLWLLNEVVYHYYPSNILEPTLSVFALVSIYFLIKTCGKRLTNIYLFYIVIAGVAIFCATLSKGAVGLFPLALFGIHWLVFRNFSILQCVIRTVLLVGVVVLLYGMLLSFDSAHDSLSKYLDTQVLASITEQRTEYHHRDNRLYIVGRLFEVLIPALITTTIILLLTRTKISPFKNERISKFAIFFTSIGLSASLPIIVSPKQSIYYLLPCFPYFAIALGILISPIIGQWVQEFVKNKRKHQRAKVTLFVVFLISLGFTSYNIGTVTKRDKKVFHDVCEIGSVVAKGTTIGSKAYSAHLVGYLYRMFEISIDTSSLDKDHLIVEKPDSVNVDTEKYSKLKLHTLQYDLYRKKP